MEKVFKYDVAISCLDKDRAIAEELLKPLEETFRFNVFLYVHRQEEIAGTGDGMDVFSSVFRRDSRLAVVFFREGWGKTKWTRIEETAIKERLFEEGARPLLFIMVDKKDTPPAWLPGYEIRVNLEDYGIDEAVVVVKRRLEELGATVREETLAERTIRSAKLAAFKKESERLRRCSEGVLQVTAAAAEYLAIVEKMAIEMKAAAPQLDIQIGRNDIEVAFTGGGISLSTARSPRSINSLDDAFISIRVFRSQIILPGQTGFIYVEGFPKPSKERKSRPERVNGPTGAPTWYWRSTQDAKIRTPEELAKYAIGLFLDELDGRADNPKYQAFFV